MEQRKQVLLRIEPSLFRIGLKTLLEERGYLVTTTDSLSQQVSGLPLCVDYTVVGSLSNGAPISEHVLTCLSQAESNSNVVVVRSLTKTELNRVLSLGVHAVLSLDIAPERLISVFNLLPNHQIVDYSIVVPSGFEGKPLTNREWEVVSLLALGSTVRQCAQLLNLSVKTLEAHKYNIMRKLDIHNRVGLALWYSDNKNNHPIQSGPG